MGSGRSPVGGGGSAGGGGATKAAVQQDVQDSVVQATAPILNNPVGNATAMTDAMATALRQQEDSTYNAMTKAAVKMYISDTDFDQQGHSLSQTMNYLLDEGVDFSNMDRRAINKKYNLNLTDNDISSLQYTYTRMNSAFHPIGSDVRLQRGAHDDLLRNVFGIADYTQMSPAQLQKSLVGKAFRNTSPMSTSYDIKKNPFLGNGPASGGREVVYNIKAGKNTPMLFGARAQSEVVLGYANWKITGVRYTGKTATPRGKSSKPQIEIDIETF